MRNDILNRKEEILEWITENRSKAFIYKNLKCKATTLDSYLIRWGITYSGNKGCKGYKQSTYRKSATDYMNSTGVVKSHILKIKLIEDGIKKHICEECTLDTWNEKPIPIELHHIDGNRYNNVLDNLMILCPNCHSQTGSNSGKNKGKYEMLQ